MSTFVTHAAWTLTVAFTLSLAYEFYRATVRAGVSRHDSIRVFVREGIPLYVTAAVVIALLFAGYRWTVWVGLAFSLAAIAVSIVHYNPHIMIERRPALVDWFEDLVFTGLLFVAVAQLVYALLDTAHW